MRRRSIAGQIVFDATHAPVAGARVTIDQGTLVHVEAITDDAGRFQLDEVPVGQYRIHAHAPPDACPHHDPTGQIAFATTQCPRDRNVCDVGVTSVCRPIVDMH